MYPVNQQPSFHFCDAFDRSEVGAFCSHNLPLWKSTRLQEMPDFLIDFRKGGGGGTAPVGFGDEEAEQQSTFSVGTGAAPLAGEMLINANGTLVLRAPLQGVQSVTVKS